jgi:hypothetical protein
MEALMAQATPQQEAAWHREKEPKRDRMELRSIIRRIIQSLQPS